jgi:FixJ family two-component response regulator
MEPASPVVASFWVLARDESAAPRAPNGECPLPSCPCEGWVAIVDDDESIRRSLGRLFRTNGINVTTFCSGEDYLSRVVDGDPRCIVLDVQLCGSSGFDLQDRLCNEGRATPIVFITALDEIPSAQLESRSGPYGFLRKPFDTRALLDLVLPHVVSQV